MGGAMKGTGTSFPPRRYERLLGPSRPPPGLKPSATGRHRRENHTILGGPHATPSLRPAPPGPSARPVVRPSHGGLGHRDRGRPAGLRRGGKAPAPHVHGPPAREDPAQWGPSHDRGAIRRQRRP